VSRNQKRRRWRKTYSNRPRPEHQIRQNKIESCRSWAGWQIRICLQSDLTSVSSAGPHRNLFRACKKSAIGGADAIRPQSKEQRSAAFKSGNLDLIKARLIHLPLSAFCCQISLFSAAWLNSQVGRCAIPLKPAFVFELDKPPGVNRGRGVVLHGGALASSW